MQIRAQLLMSYMALSQLLTTLGLNSLIREVGLRIAHIHVRCVD